MAHSSHAIPSDRAERPDRRLSLHRRILDSLFTHNPFYLLSVCCLLHGGRYWIQSRGGASTEFLMAAVAGYILILAVIALLIVRLGKVWDDARSILLLVPILFVEFSLTFDGTLLTRPVTGPFLLIAGYLFTTGVAEALLRGLRIRLAGVLRASLHLFLAVMMLYPLLFAARWSISPSTASWLIYAYFPLTASLALLLVPAIRKGAELAERSNTPWKWPWFPWSFVAVLLTGVVVRGYALSLSFDPVLSLGLDAAMALETAWGFYFLSPIILAMGWLLLEFSIAAQVVKLERFALLFPLIALGCSLYDVNASAAFFAFRDEYRSVVAAPAFLILLGAGIFYWIALFRRIPLAQFGLAVTIGLFSAIGPDTDDVHAIALLSPWPIAASASFLFARGLLIRSTVEMFAGVLVSALAIAIGLPNVPDSWKLVICIHWVGIGVLGLGVFFQDAFARFLRIVAAGFLLTGSLLAMRDWRLPGWMWPDWIPYLYLFVLAMTAFALAYHFRSRVYLIMAFLQITAAGSLFAQQISAELQKRPDWRGMASVSFAFLLLAIAGGISAVKGGAFDRILARALRRDD